MSELLRCPFCGSEAEYEGLYVYCTGCLVQMPNEPDEAEAIAAWNRRPSRETPAVVEAVARGLCAKHYADRFTRLVDDEWVIRNVNGNWHYFQPEARAAIEAYHKATGG